MRNVATDNAVPCTPPEPETDLQQRPDRRSASSAGDDRQPVCGGLVGTAEERASALVKPPNANGVCSNGLAAGGGSIAAKTCHSSRRGSLCRRLNAVVRDRIVFFTKKERSPSAKS